MLEVLLQTRAVKSQARCSVWQHSRADQQSVHVVRKRLGHLLPTNIGDRIQGQAVEDLIVVVEIFANRIDDQADELGILVHEKGDCEITLGWNGSV